MANGQDVFVPVSTGPIPKTIGSRNDHPVPKNGIVSFLKPVVLMALSDPYRSTRTLLLRRTSSIVGSS